MNRRSFLSLVCRTLPWLSVVPGLRPRPQTNDRLFNRLAASGPRVADAINDFTRRKLREDAFVHRISAPRLADPAKELKTWRAVREILAATQPLNLPAKLPSFLCVGDNRK